MFCQPRSAVVGAAVAVALTLGLSACQANDQAPAASASASASPSPSPTELSAEDEAIEKAEAAVREFYRVGDVSLQDPDNFNADEYETVAISTALGGVKNYFNAVREQGYRHIGSTEVVSLTNPSVNLTNNPESSPPEIPVVEFDVCYDISERDVVDENGESTVPAGTEPRGVMLVGVANYAYPDGSWLVAYTDVQEDKTC